MGAPGQRFRKWRDPDYQSDYFNQSDSPPPRPERVDPGGIKVVVEEGQVIITRDDVGSPRGLGDCGSESVKQGGEAIFRPLGENFDWLELLSLFECLLF